LQKKFVYPDDFKTAVVEFTCEKLDLGRWTVKEDRPSPPWGDLPESESACFIARIG
jgi:hypothetical protein